VNLTIYDTPGFRLHGDPELNENIRNMVLGIRHSSISPLSLLAVFFLDLVRVPERLIVCLEQSTVEWANATSRRIIQEVDPEFRRTVLLHTKFDNRCKELRSQEEATKYLQGEDLPENCSSFFISLPVERDTSPQEFQTLIDQAYLRDFEHLHKIGVTSRQILNQVGFCKVEAFLEREMSKRYREAFLPTLQLLEQSVNQYSTQLSTLTKQLTENDPQRLQQRSFVYVQEVCGMVERLLTGSAVGNPETFGQTLAQERSLAGGLSWTALDLDYPIENSGRKLYGGPQFYRLTNEFSWISHSAEFPHTSIDEVAAALGAHPSHNIPSYEAAASDLVQLKAKKVLHPLLETATHRSFYIMNRLFDVAVAVIQKDNFELATVSTCEAFMDAFRSIYTGFLTAIHKNCHENLLEDIKTFTEVLDWDILRAEDQALPSAAAGTGNSREETSARVHQIMQRQDTIISFPSGRQVDEATYQKFNALCCQLFHSVRTQFVHLVRNKLSALILKPMFDQMRQTVIASFSAMPTDQFKTVFESGAQAVEKQRNIIERKLKNTTALRDQFRQAESAFKSAISHKQSSPALEP
jgi:hypothetical protein